jgi:membrane protease YdiL (CAAX protease family)
MSVAAAGTARAGDGAERAVAAGAIIAGCAALAYRPVTGLALAPIFGSIAAAGLWTPAGEPAAAGERPGAAWWWGVTAAGLAAFALARVMLGPGLPATTGAFATVSVCAAAVAEEAFFRRLIYGWLDRWGALAAIAGSAGAFALVHVPAWGTRSWPTNLAAGALLGWQRWAAGTWTAPAATHAAANLLMAL